MQRAFTYGAIAPMMWMLVAIGSVELLVTHLLVMIWWPTLGTILSVVSMVALAWLTTVILSFDRLPVLLTEDRLVMRAGSLRAITIPLTAVKALSADWTAERLRCRDVVNLALLAYPNVVVQLDPPVQTRRKSVTLVAHRLDDPVGFAAALNAVVGTA